MSRIGRQPIVLPAGVTAEVTDTSVTIKGPKGALSRSLVNGIRASLKENVLTVDTSGNTKDEKSLPARWGLARALIAGMVQGVANGFEKRLELSGIGFRAEVGGGKLTLRIGFSHPVVIPIPPELLVTVDKNEIIIKGIDKELTGAFAARLHGLRRPDPYQGKGVYYAGEKIRRKQGKVVKSVGAAA
ncbi:MAG: 50S ribosomal protein L6 [Parcubacteria group bacterium]|nr:50S ribosomal protein L6 [Parcubacteria group bacterium]